jgi:prepilin-type N-terminal cleavage/methylation domain-containing protein
MKRGFTLIEILVVVVILGIAGAIIVPQLGTRDDQKALAAARMLVADLIYAQNMSITQQGVYYVAFDAANQRYSVMRASDDTVITHPVSKMPYTVQLGSAVSSSMQGVTVDSATITGQSGNSGATIGFNELGTPLAGSGTDSMTSGVIRFRSGLCRMPVTIEPFTGQISVGPMQ